MPKLKHKTKKLKSTTGFDIFNNILMGLLALIALFPFYYVIITSFANWEDIHKVAIYLFPMHFNFDNYKLVFDSELFMNSLFVSIFVTVVGTFISMFITTSAAYTLSKKGIPGSKILFTIVLIPMFFSGGLIPFYLTVQKVGLINNIFCMILPVALNSFWLIVMKNFLESLPASIEESAKIDGANDIYILYKIVVPMAAPAIASISLFYAVDRWNEWYNAMLFISNKNLYPMQLVLREVLQDATQTLGSGTAAAIASSNKVVYQESLKMALVVIATIPIICVYPFIQGYFTKGIMIGAVKE